MAINRLLINDLTTQQKELLLKAKEQMSYAYNLYSGYFVGAVVQTESKKLYSSCNMENSSYGLSVCAEVGAIQSAFAAGDTSIHTIAICGGLLLDKGGIVPTPCGRCRQLIYEASQLSNVNIQVLCANADLSEIISTTIMDLLPEPFGPKDLGLEPGIEGFIERLKGI